MTRSSELAPAGAVRVNLVSCGSSSCGSCSCGSCSCGSSNESILNHDNPGTPPRSPTGNDIEETGRPFSDQTEIHGSPFKVRPNSRYPGLILQPDSSPVSTEQLRVEVRKILDGLLIVESHCIASDTDQAKSPHARLDTEQWQALVALHRTLLYEHYDFLMVTQHPSAPQALRDLATKYNMPARMWRHGIHAFLEVLRHRWPFCMDSMRHFVYLAYSMIALLLETVPSFNNTWLECLGDLARYGIASEEDEDRAIWRGIAARWYTMVSDRNPAVGRLYHHLGILERASLRKFFLYAKSLSCEFPFPNARDSLSTLCGSITKDENTIQSSVHSAEGRIVTYHALVYTSAEQDVIRTIGTDALRLLQQHPFTFRDLGAYLAVTNFSALLELGSPENLLYQQYASATSQATQRFHQSNTQTRLAAYGKQSPTPSPGLISTIAFWEHSFLLVLKNAQRCDQEDVLPYIHVMLVCMHSLHSLRTRLSTLSFQHQTNPLVYAARLAMGELAEFLNTLVQGRPISAQLLWCARQNKFPAPDRKEDMSPLPEDFLVRGLVWAQFYFCPSWFDNQGEDDGRAIESTHTHLARIERVLWLSLYLAFHTELLHYDEHMESFSAPRTTSSLPPSMLFDLAEVDVAIFATTAFMWIYYEAES